MAVIKARKKKRGQGGQERSIYFFIERLLAGSSVKQFSRSVFIIRNRVNRVKRYFYLKKKLRKEGRITCFI